MSTEVKAAGNGSRWKLSLDTWAVLAAFLAALLFAPASSSIFLGNDDLKRVEGQTRVV